MATRFPGWSVFLLAVVAAIVLAACGDGDDGAPQFGECSGELPSGPVALVGHVLGVSPSGPEAEPGFESVIVRIGIVQSEVSPDYPGLDSDRLQLFLRDPDVILLGDLITEVDVGDCVRVAGQEQRYSCGPACDAAGFVASFFEVLNDE